ncbi:hypothetical protein AVEN_46251-1 [Araneus ventricosus]|uniref:Reverse transcriptase RNase H-like domain-containing protein n=1 Tax=Araneus ventricosus TaxID=182803 RepID=A0A4Y2FAA8_ARAVE|nr:hypothetical protein AVEN_46251-1 [Araneus ventricosus]
MLEGRKFQIFADQKPIIYAFKQNPDKCSPRQLRHLDFISQYSTDIRNVRVSKNVVADSLSRIELNSITKSALLNFSELAKAQQNDPETVKVQQDKSSSLQLALKPCLSTNSDLICDISTASSRPLVPESFRRLILEQLHNISHPGIAATAKLISSRYRVSNKGLPDFKIK